MSLEMNEQLTRIANALERIAAFTEMKGGVISDTDYIKYLDRLRRWEAVSSSRPAPASPEPQRPSAPRQDYDAYSSTHETVEARSASEHPEAEDFLMQTGAYSPHADTLAGAGIDAQPDYSANDREAEIERRVHTILQGGPPVTEEPGRRAGITNDDFFAYSTYTSMCMEAGHHPVDFDTWKATRVTEELPPLGPTGKERREQAKKGKPAPVQSTPGERMLAVAEAAYAEAEREQGRRNFECPRCGAVNTGYFENDGVTLTAPVECYECHTTIGGKPATFEEPTGTQGRTAGYIRTDDPCPGCERTGTLKIVQPRALSGLKPGIRCDVCGHGHQYAAPLEKGVRYEQCRHCGRLDPDPRGGADPGRCGPDCLTQPT